MAERNVPWPVWAFVTLAVALLGSPVLNHYLADEAAKDGAETPLVPKPLQVEVTVKQDGSGPAPSAGTDDRGYKPLKVSQGFPTVASAGAVTSQRYLTRADVAGLSSWELDLLRNEIYARHGRTFRRQELQSHFDAQSWYRPVYAPDSFNEGLLSPVERWNAEFIAEYQRQNF
ncbi:MAG TPA: YARHG domain-containing protein [Longimicrobium sp.]|nr:YARHG domain-containing protein [Longimicrobium sp.]